jgi:hypothetical protein
MTSFKIPKVPNAVNNKFTEIVMCLKSFCKDNLNNEYYELAVKLATKIARKRPSPLATGRTNTWAAGIIHTVGMVNFLFDKSQNPHMTAGEIAEWFDLAKSTISSKSNSIREMFRIYQLDPNWTLPSKMNDNPKAWMISVDGFIVDVRYASRDLQEIAFEKGLIPYLPAKNETSNPVEDER